MNLARFDFFVNFTEYLTIEMYLIFCSDQSFQRYSYGYFQNIVLNFMHKVPNFPTYTADRVY